MRIGKIVITLSASKTADAINTEDIGKNVPTRVPNTHAANLNEWTGEDTNIARLEDNSIGVSGNNCRKY